MFTSNRNGFEMPRGNNMGFNIPFQLFVMDGDGSNVEMIGHLNIASALRPVALKDGRVMFSSLEDQGFRSDLDWGIWSIHPDGADCTDKMPGQHHVCNHLSEKHKVYFWGAFPPSRTIAPCISPRAPGSVSVRSALLRAGNEAGSPVLPRARAM